VARYVRLPDDSRAARQRPATTADVTASELDPSTELAQPANLDTISSGHVSGRGYRSRVHPERYSLNLEGES
jgi:hypothetical protein